MAPPISHQTVRLSAGKHASPAEGACVMELASMLAGEPFTDRPQSVCPVVASYLRALNDLLDDRRRQLLYRYAAAAVGTAGGDAARRARLECCRSTFELAASRSPVRRLIARTARSAPMSTPIALEHFTLTLVRALRRGGGPGWHRAAFALADELIALPAAQDAALAARQQDASPARARPSSCAAGR